VVFNVLDPHGVSLWIKPLNGGSEAPLESFPELNYSDGWAATSAGIYFTDSSSGIVRVNYFDFASRTTRMLMTLKQSPLPGGGGPGIAVSRDGHWLLYSEIDDEQSDILLAPVS
jgi:hypothetical protein